MEAMITRLSDAAAATTDGASALVAAGVFHPGDECVVGELVWVSDLCDDLPCRCEWGFNGLASDGVARVAEVRRFTGVSRASIQRALVARMVPAGYPPSVARARVDALLDVAAASPEGTLFRLEHGRPTAFPPGARITGPTEVVVPAVGLDR